MNKDGRGRFKAYSAGVAPATAIDPRTVELLRSEGFSVDGVQPMHFSEFAATGAQRLDFVFTLSDTAAGEPLPQWPGLPVTAHWSCPDPILVEGAEWEKNRAFAHALSELQRRIRIFISLPFASLDRKSLKTRVDDIGRSESSSALRRSA